MTVALMVLTDGRDDCLHQAIGSFLENGFQPDVCLIVDDSGVEEHGRALSAKYGPLGFEVLRPRPYGKSGFHGAIQAGWDALIWRDVDFVFHLEDDFVFPSRIQFDEMVRVLDLSPHLCQVSLKRQAWSPEEKAAGGLVEMWPDLYEQHEKDDLVWTEQKLFFTTNPSLYRKSLMAEGWPQQKGSEAEFTRRMKEKGFGFAYIGGKFDAPRTHHIGDTRTGVGY